VISLGINLIVTDTRKVGIKTYQAIKITDNLHCIQSRKEEKKFALYSKNVYHNCSYLF
jgi:hypothetical protein